ncbi:uncharacterized protein LOC120985723 [Bufo bufo]|uniref:uncharacterized protein LOC120985723 n=1 Tax=Bufo bufo TaxID=8384 RepID=UPI001ABE442E|nr:uncharacterized protein LOC120985723 [Bufo bufo]
MSTWVNMETPRTGYNLRSVHAIFLLLVVSSVLLGFSYLNEMYQRIQLQEMMERQAKHIEAERSIIEHKASRLQAHIENSNNEMKRLKDVHAFQIEKQNSICEQERNNLLQTISSKNYTLTEVQTGYKHLKRHFEHLQSVMAQFEKNQSRLLEKFSTQSTQCMNVINMISKLCNKDKVIRKIAQVTKQNETQSSKTEKKNYTGLLNTTTPTKDTTMDSGNETQSLKAMQELQELFSELNKTNGMKDNEDEIMKLEDTRNPAENIFKLQAEEGTNNNETSDEEDQPNNMLIQEQQTGSNEKPPALKPNQSKTKKVNNSYYPMLLSRDKSLPLTNQNDIRADEEVTDKPLEDITVGIDNVISEDNAYSTENNLDVQKKKIKKLDEYINKAKGESEYEHQRLTKGLELNDQEILEIIS